MVADLLRRADALCAQTGLTRTALSKRLFGDTRILGRLSDGSARCFAETLERASKRLEALEANPPTPGRRRADQQQAA
jgi:hypothetical protein